MNIHGLSKTTLLDYPGHVAATIFTGGCNFLCPFCHNGDLVQNPAIYPLISEEEVMAHLRKRRNILTGVCITGGEATLQKDLPEFIKAIKDLGLLVKLDTNGYRPDVLKSLIDQKLLDYVAMDIKAGHAHYGMACGLKNIDISRIEESINLLLEGSLDYEFRTTVVNGIHDDSDFQDISHWIEGAGHYYLQSYKEGDAVIDKSMKSFSNRYLDHFLTIVQKTIPTASLRGID